MTAVRFNGGEVLEIDLTLREVRDLVQEALAHNVLLELTAKDGRKIVINPHQVQVLQDAKDAEATRSENGAAQATV